jgi:uncharacterized protein YjbI with pentapeptide repeats
VKSPAAPQLAPSLTSVNEIEFNDDECIEDVETSAAYLEDRARFVEITGSRFVGTELTSYVFENLTLTDVIFNDCELSGVSFAGESRLLRVQFNDCRMTGFNISGAKAEHVVFNRCKLNSSNFRMSSLTRCEFNDCEMPDADFMQAGLTETRFHSCRLQSANFARVRIENVALNGSTIDDIDGAGSLTGVTIGTDQVLALALPLLSAMKVTVTDDI